MVPAADHVTDDMKRLGLGGYAAELDKKAHAVLPPYIACPNGLKNRLLVDRQL